MSVTTSQVEGAAPPVVVPSSRAFQVLQYLGFGHLPKFAPFLLYSPKPFSEDQWTRIRTFEFCVIVSHESNRPPFQCSQPRLIVVLTALTPISDIDGKISDYQHFLSSLPRSHPSTFLFDTALALSYQNRYVQSNRKQDLDRAIFHFTQAIFVSRLAGDIDAQIVVQTFFLLASMLLQRADHFDQPSDAHYCAEYFRYLQSQQLEAFDVPSSEVRASLVGALVSQVKLGIGDAVRHIDEMTDHCCELLASDVPWPDLSRAARALANASLHFCEQNPGEGVLDKLIKCLREANRRLDSHELDHNFATLLFSRFAVTHAIDDYEEAMALFDKILSSEPHGDEPGSYLQDAAYNSALLAMTRSRIYMNQECFEEAIHRCRSFLRISPTDDPRRCRITKSVASRMELRSMAYGATESSQESQSGDTEVIDVPSFSGLVASLLSKSTAGKSLWWKGKGREVHLQALNSVCSTTDYAEIEQAIKYCRLLLASNPPRHADIFQTALSLGRVLFHAFKCTDKFEYLNQSIATFRDMLQMSIPNYTRVHVIRFLLEVLWVRISLSGEWDDFEEAMQLHSVVSKDTHGHGLVQWRFFASCDWASNARLNQHPSTPTAYETAITLMEDMSLYAPTLETQHFHLLAFRSDIEDFPMDYASYEVGRG